MKSLYRCIALLCFCLLSQWCFSVEAPYAVTGATTVDVYQARGLYDNGAVFIDVRSDEEWHMGHIQGAIHLNLKDDFKKLYYASGETKSAPIVIYCNGENCLRSAYAAAISVLWGYRNVYYFRDGYFSWVLEDFPLNLRQIAELE